MSTKAPTTGVEALTDVEAYTEFARAFKGANAALRRLRGREARHPSGLSDAQYGLLFSLCDSRPLSSSELAHAADLSAPATTEMLDALAAAGLVERHRSERDRRVVLTSLTEQGLALVQERRARYEPLWRAALGEFSDRDLRRAAAVLNSVRAMFDRIAEDDPTA